MAVGNLNRFGSDKHNRHNKAEVFFHSTSTWNIKASYPFHKVIMIFEIVAHSDSFILFSGTSGSTYDGDTDKIAKFNPASDQWTKIGNLQQSRRGFGVIKMGKKFLVIGGRSEALTEGMHTEVCELNNELIKCTSREPTLNYFIYYPALMIVSSDYADNC